jgi:hypothetical protein
MMAAQRQKVFTSQDLSWLFYIRKYSFLFLILILFSCSNRDPKKPLATGDLQFSAFTWHFNPNKDTFEIYIARFLRIDSDGRFVGIRHETFRSKPKYISGAMPDSLRKYVDSVLFKDNNKTGPIDSDNMDRIYDGLTYSLEYRKGDSVTSSVIFRPYSAPPDIQYIATELDRLVSQSHPNSIDSFSIEEFKAELEKRAAAAGISIPIYGEPKVILKDN